MKFKCLILLSFILSLAVANPNTLAAKGKSLVKGRVTDISGTPVSNAFVLIDGSNTGSLTDSEGNYRIRVRQEASVIGIMTLSMGYREENISGRRLIDFRFARISNQHPSSNENLRGDEVVDMGYSSVRRRDVTNSVGIFERKDTKKVYTSVQDMIKEIPGINSRVFNMFGPVGPAVVVNGQMNYDLNSILPSMVESIVFLRDGSASIYGSRAFGGVILIKLKTTMLDK